MTAMTSPPVQPIRFEPSTYQHAFIQSRALENLIEGPRGEGKTEAGIVAIAVHARRQRERGFQTPQPWAICRDTWINLERTTLKSLKNSILSPRLIFRDGGKKVRERSGLFELELFGMDDVRDLNIWQSLQLAGVWFEETAPAMEADIGSGIQEDAWNMAMTSLRFPCDQPRAQITQNPPDEDHWSQLRFYGVPETGVQPVDNTFAIRIPSGTNPHLPLGYRERMAAALRNNPALARRLVEGLPGFVQTGEAVTPEYQERSHRTSHRLDPIPGVQVIRAWDGWHNPTVIFAQLTPLGRLVILDTIRGENMGVRQLIRTRVAPLIAARYKEVHAWRDLGDESMRTPDQSDTTVSAAGVIETELRTTFEPVKNEWNPRREAMRTVLTSSPDGRPMLQVSGHERVLHQALRGGYHYRKNPDGTVVRDIPVKNLHSHPGDAFGYLCLAVAPWKPPRKGPGSGAVEQKNRRVAASYAG